MTQQPLPETHEEYTDKYFLRSKQILEAEGLNPWVRAQLFIRKGPGTVHGIEEAVAIIDKYSDLAKHGGKVRALEEGSHYEPRETIMVIEGPAQEIVTLETMILGVIAAETTKANDKVEVDLDSVKQHMAKVVEAAGGRPVSYFGARHWRWDEDAAISRAAHEGGATSCSTDVGAETFGQKGVGTIPHALENIYAWKYGKENAVAEATKAFDRHIDPAIPRIALVDYNNREIDDAIATAEALGKKLYGLRIDTCGENIMQGVLSGTDTRYDEFWRGRGVSIHGVYAVRQALDKAGYQEVKIILSSGFGNPAKVKAFSDTTEELGTKLYDALGVGEVYQSRSVTMDIVAVGNDANSLVPMSKIGRDYHPNPRLELMLGGAA